MFDSRVLLIPITVIEISSVFVFEISIIFVRFLSCVGFIIYVFEMIMAFFLFVELISTRIIKGVLSKYKI